MDEFFSYNGQNISQVKWNVDIYDLLVLNWYKKQIHAGYGLMISILSS